MAPLIGILLDYAPSGSFSRRPHYALRRHYFDAVRQAGGVAMALPAEAEGLEMALARLDGLVVPGGFFPSPAAWYVEPPADPAAADPAASHPRSGADLVAARFALDRGLPILGICAGMQVLSVAAGARMTRDVHGHTGTALDHLNGAAAEQRYHRLEIVANSRLRAILGTARLSVNSAHREAVVETPPALHVTARAEDGVIEAVELPDHPFAIGVQWHPEFFLNAEDPDRQLFQALAAAADRHSRRRSPA